MHVDYYTVKSRICQEILQKYFSNLTRMGIKMKKRGKNADIFDFFRGKLLILIKHDDIMIITESVSLRFGYAVCEI